ncbi:hypothetical protein [Streptomyces sp. NPDC057686]|uniref:hypothetical protein n=1 Tax=Streptomyces sp. NPDC057686 TaxID=3346212 RepID=UPI0036822AF9
MSLQLGTAATARPAQQTPPDRLHEKRQRLLLVCAPDVDWRHDGIMSKAESEAEEAKSRVRAQRLDTARSIQTLRRRLRDLHHELLQCSDEDEDRVQDLLHAAGVVTGIWLDDVVCRFVDPEHDSDELFAKAWQLVDRMPLESNGFLSSQDSALFASLRGMAANMLARIWISGFLLGPIPEDAWPNHDLAIHLLAGLDHHLDDRDLKQDLENFSLLGDVDHQKDDGAEGGAE